MFTFEFDAYEVCVAQVLQEDPVAGGGLEVEGDVGTRLPSEGGEVQVGGRRVEGSSVPIVTCQVHFKHNHTINNVNVFFSG